MERMPLSRQYALCRLLHGPATAAELTSKNGTTQADLDALKDTGLVRLHQDQYSATENGRSTILNNPDRWYDLPKDYRLFRIGSDWGIELVGLELDIFIPALSGFYPVPMGLGAAAKYLFYHWADAWVLWVGDDGRLARTYCTVKRHRNYNTIAVYTISGNPVILQGMTDGKPDLSREVWYNNNGDMLHEVGPDGMHKQNGRSYSSYRIELERARNRLGITSIDREYPNNRIAEKYKLQVGDPVTLVFPMPVYSRSDPPSPVTVGKTYTLVSGPEYGRCTITTDHPNQTIKVKRGQIVKVPQEDLCW